MAGQHGTGDGAVGRMEALPLRDGESDRTGGLARCRLRGADAVDEAKSGAVCLGLETVGEDDRDGEAAVCGSPPFAKPLDAGRGFGGGVEVDALAVDADADEAVQGAKVAPEGPLRCVVWMSLMR